MTVWSVHRLIVISVVVLFVAAVGNRRYVPDQVAARDTTEDRVSALETRVASLETQVAEGGPVITVVPGSYPTAEVDHADAVTGDGQDAGMDPVLLASLPPGEAGKVVVIAYTPLFDTQYGGPVLRFIVRNNTDKVTTVYTVTVTVYDSTNHKMTGVASEDRPVGYFRMAPGEVAIGTLDMRDVVIPDSSEYTFSVHAESDSTDPEPLNLSAGEWMGNTFIGELRNDSE